MARPSTAVRRLLAAATALLLLGALAPPSAMAAARKPLRRAVVVNPAATIAGAVGAALGLPAGALDVRYHQQLDPRWGLTVGLDAATVPVLLIYDVAVLKAGPRISLSRPGLAGWHALPLVLLGWGQAHNSHGKRLAASVIAGVGVEAGYTWAFGGLVLECGAGLQAWRMLDGEQRAFSDLLPPLKPVLNASIGYGW